MAEDDRGSIRIIGAKDHQGPSFAFAGHGLQESWTIVVPVDARVLLEKSSLIAPFTRIQPAQSIPKPTSQHPI